MSKSELRILSAFKRAFRYQRTLAWLLGVELRLLRPTFLRAAALGIFNQLGSLIVFVTTIKCALWLLKPDAIPHWISDRLPVAVGSTEFVLILLSIPSTIAIMAAMAGKFYNKLRQSLSMQCAVETASDIIAQRASRLAPFAKVGESLDKEAKSLAKTHESDLQVLVHSHTALIDSIVTLAVVVLAITIALLIDPLVTGAVVFVAATLALAYNWHMHESKYAAEQQKIDLDEKAKAREMELAELVAGTMRGERQPQSLKDATSAKMEDRLAERAIRLRLQSLSVLAMDLGQSFILLIMLIAIYARGMNMTASEIAYLMILVFVLRFIVAQLRVLSVRVSIISRHYKKLTEFAAAVKA